MIYKTNISTRIYAIIKIFLEVEKQTHFTNNLQISTFLPSPRVFLSFSYHLNSFTFT